jgi:hypothetical protein
MPFPEPRQKSDTQPTAGPDIPVIDAGLDRSSFIESVARRSDQHKNACKGLHYGQKVSHLCVVPTRTATPEPVLCGRLPDNSGFRRTYRGEDAVCRWTVGLLNFALVRVVLLGRVVAWCVAECAAPWEGVSTRRSRLEEAAYRVEGGPMADPHGAPTTTFPLAWPCSRYAIAAGISANG